MVTFTPTTDPGKPPVEGIGHTDRWSLWRWYSDNTTGFVPIARTVVITSGVASPLASEGPRTFSVSELNAADSGSGDGGKAVFTRANTYTITAGEDTILQAAGYTTV